VGRDRAFLETGGEEPVAHLLPDILVVGFDRRNEIGRHRTIARWNAILRSALEDRQMPALGSNGGDKLDTRRAGADHGHTLVPEIDAAPWPIGGVNNLALKLLTTGNIGQIDSREQPERGDQKLTAQHLPLIRAHFPTVRIFVVMRTGDGRPELHVASQVEAIGYVLEIGQDFRLFGIAILPAPFVPQVGIERIAVDKALDVRARTRISVPVPRAPDAIRLVDETSAQSHLIDETMQGVEAAKSGSDNDDVGRCCRLSPGNRTFLVHYILQIGKNFGMIAPCLDPRGEHVCLM
jgi:hypothetical protein